MIVTFLDTTDNSNYERENVKAHTRLVNGKLIRVNQFSRNNNRSQTLEENNNDNELLNKLKNGVADISFKAAIAGLSLVGIGLATKTAIVARHNTVVEAAAKRIKESDGKLPTDLRFLAKSNDKLLPENFDNYEGIIIATGGWGRQKGQHTLALAEELKKQYPKHYVVSVENQFFDLGFDQGSDLIDFFKRATKKMFSSAINGNQTSDELATLAYSIRKKTNKSISYITASGGGMGVKQAMEVTDKLGLKDIQGVGMGSPTWGLSNPKSKYISVMDKSDRGTGFLPLTSKKDLVEVKRDPNIKTILKRDPYQGKIPINKHHEFDYYLTAPESRAHIDNLVYRTDRFRKEDYTPDYENLKVKHPLLSFSIGKWEREAIKHFELFFNESNSANFASKEVKVKAYVRNGKLVRAYSRDQDVEDKNILANIRDTVENTVEKKTKNENIAEVAGQIAVGTTLGVAGLIGGGLIVEGLPQGVLSIARSVWNRSLPKRTKMIEDLADELVSGVKKLKNGQTLKEAIKDADTVIVMKGGINMNSQGATQIKERFLNDLANDAKKNMGKKWSILDLDNLELDSHGLSSKKPLQQTLKDFWSNFVVNPFSKGYNKDSIEMAGYMRAIEKLKPDTNKVMIGYSAGGVATIAAASDLAKLKNVSRLKAITFGAPYSGVTKIDDNRVVDTISIINRDDPLANSLLAKGNRENINGYIVDRPDKKKPGDDILKGHDPWQYFHPTNKDKIMRTIEGGSREWYSKAIK